LTNDLRRLYLWVNITLTDDDIVVISGVESLINISSLITQQSPRTLQNYMIWRFLIYRISNMPKRFRTIFDQLKKTVLGVVEEQPRASICAEYVNNNMGFAVSKLYINKYFDKVARTKVFIIIVNTSLFLYIL
jgi:predicted metalloendopeptidase